jgi:hypothetical protein
MYFLRKENSLVVKNKEAKVKTKRNEANYYFNILIIFASNICLFNKY